MGDRDTTRAKSALEDGKGKGKWIGALENVGKEEGISNLGSRTWSERNKRLQNLINYLCPKVLGIGRKERERTWVLARLFKGC